MIIRWLLFETRLGALLLSYLERNVGLAVVDADWLGKQRPELPTSMVEAE